MKILHTNFHRGWGGQSNRILTVCRGLVERGHEVTLAVPEGSKLAERAGGSGIEIFTKARFTRGFRPRKVYRDVRAIRSLLRSNPFDIVHTHGSQDSWAVTYALTGFSPRPVVLRTKHNVFPIRDHLLNRRLYGTWTDGLICISEAILEYCAAKPYLRRENLSLIHSAVNAGRFQIPRNRSWLEEWKIQDRFVAGVTGRLREEKGHRFLIDALPRIVRDVPRFVLLVVGSGSLDGELREQVRRLGMDEHVIFTGFRTDIPEVLASLDLFVMPSISEGLGTAILEAGAAGLPIVSTHIGGIPDIITDGNEGLLVPPQDRDALADAIVRMSVERDFATACGQHVREKVDRNFSEQALVEKTETAYAEWLHRKRGDSKT